MELQNSLTELFWNPVTVDSIPTFAISLLTAAALGAILGQVYIRFGTALSNRRQFARNFVLLTVTTTLIASDLKTMVQQSDFKIVDIVPTRTLSRPPNDAQKK